MSAISLDKFIFSLCNASDLLLKRGTIDRKSKKIYQSGKTHRVGESTSARIIRKIGQIPWTYTLAREREKKILKARQFRGKGYLVITDRYPQSQYIDICDGPRYYLNPNIKNNYINKMLLKHEKRCFELANMVKPDAVIILNISPEEAYKRKKDEVEIESHKNLMDTILKLDFGEGTKRIVIDANQPLNKVIIDVTQAVWRCL